MGWGGDGVKKMTNVAYYEEILYVCENCGWDEFHAKLIEDMEVIPSTSYWIYTCDQCETENVNIDNKIFHEGRK